MTLWVFALAATLTQAAPPLADTCLASSQSVVSQATAAMCLAEAEERVANGLPKGSLERGLG
ncbi:MAG: hypothetical protein ABL982_22905, partial [Vicinamibacterales bacterium]